MVRPDVAAKKIARATAWLEDADAILSQSRDAFMSDRQGRDLAAFYLFLAIQECIDLAAHWIADSGWTPPETASSTFDVLAERGVIDAELADGMRAAAGLRNRIAHGYALLDHGRLHDEATEGLKTIRSFLVGLSAAITLPDSPE
jgi:uncharacterized protein YutE (UPF0331/DUF86 family)